MLVLSRKPLESIVIGSDVRVSIIRIDRNHVRIGIEAPGDVAIVRAELLDDSEAPAGSPRFETYSAR
ncbi:MAG: carbon storage regulator [Isosphaeraceae bacterium]